jgi:uncharacterized protein (DUF58 family)
MSPVSARLPGRMRGLPFFLSRRFFIVFGGVSTLLAAAWVLNPAVGWLAVLIGNGVVLGAALLDYLTGASPGDVLVERPLPFPLAVDRLNEIRLRVAARTGYPISILLWDDIPPSCRTGDLPLRLERISGGETRVAYGLTPLERGDGEFGNIHVWVSGRLGLVWKRGEMPATATVKLYPGLALIERYGLRARRPVLNDAVRPLWRKGHGSEFESLREYVVGDDSRLIHWRTSARKGKPIVRQNRMERSQIVFIVLDAGRMMTALVNGRTKLDHSLDAALLIAYAALEMGDQVGIMVVAREVLCFLGPSRASGQFGRILDATYRLEARLEEARYHMVLSGLSLKLKRRSLVIAFTDFIDERSSEGFRRYIAGLVPRHLPLIVAMADEEVARLADGAPRDRWELYRQGVAAEMLARREHLIAGLKSAGVMTVDTSRRRLSGDVLEQYLRIKDRGLL